MPKAAAESDTGNDTIAAAADEAMAEYQAISTPCPRPLPRGGTAPASQRFRLVGLTGDFDEVHIEGQLSEGNFMAYCIRGDRVVAGIGAGDGDKTARLHALFLSADMPSARALSDAGWQPAKLPVARAC
jgi:hypothetical protein